MKYFELYLSFLIFISCGAGVGDMSDDLGGGYTYSLDGSRRMIYSDNVFKDYVYPNVIEYKFDDLFVIVLQQPSSYIENCVTEDLRSRYGDMLYLKDSIQKTKYVSRFLKSHIWRDSLLHKKIASQILPGNYFKNCDDLNNISKEIIATEPYFKSMLSRKRNYFIIDKKAQEIYGPFSKSEYALKRKELGISTKLNLQEDQLAN